jgi:hypothetical protein
MATRTVHAMSVALSPRTIIARFLDRVIVMMSARYPVAFHKVLPAPRFFKRRRDIRQLRGMRDENLLRAEVHPADGLIRGGDAGFF